MSVLFYKLAQTLNSVSNRSVQNVKMAYVVNTMKFLQIFERERGESSYVNMLYSSRDL